LKEGGANLIVTRKIIDSDPWLVDVLPAKDCIPVLRRDTFLHAGPPIEVDSLPEITRFAIAGAQIYEGLATNVKDGEKRLNSGDLQIASAHDNDAIAPMAGIVTPSMPVFVIENRGFNNRVFANINEGVGKTRTLRFGAFDQTVLNRLRWMQDTLGPSLRDAIRTGGGISLRKVIAEAVRRGDECHNRNKSSSLLLFQILAVNLANAGYGGERLASVLDFIAGNEHFFLNLSMGAAKVSLDAAQGVKESSIVTAMSANGRDFAIRLSGLGGSRPPYTWFRAQVPAVHGKYFAGYSSNDACPILGDSFSVECTGLGGFAMAAAPAITEFIGGTVPWATAITRRMYSITTLEHDYYKIPYLGYRGTPTGIDVSKVVQHGTLPTINVGLAHRRPGVGQIGAGYFRAPKTCFTKAQESYMSTYS
jgi:hypothetical protein